MLFCANTNSCQTAPEAATGTAEVVLKGAGGALGLGLGCCTEGGEGGGGGGAEYMSCEDNRVAQDELRHNIFEYR